MKETKEMKKIKILISIFMIIILISSITYASTNQTTLNIIQKSSETKYLENNQGYISKQIVESNSNTGEVTVELKVTNEKKEEGTQKYEDTEIYIIVSENLANDAEKLTKYINNIENLASKIFKVNTRTKIGIIGIKGPIRDSMIDEDGKMIIGDKDESDIDGSAENSEIVVEPTNNLETLKSGLQNMNSSKIEYYTNLQAAIRLANKSYSTNTNKILISLYDNTPSVAIGIHSKVSYGGWFSEYSTLEEAVIAKHEGIATKTKNEILTLKSSNISFILLRPDDTSYDETWYDMSTGEKALEFDGSPYVQKLYGTIDNPIYGKMYTFNDSTIDTVVTENMYEDVEKIIQQDINNVKIVDYFPNDITENFEFSYVGKQSIGTVTDNINLDENTITWNIGTLKGNEVATIRYKLKIKDMNNDELLNKEISTNEKVVFTYTDSQEKGYEVILDSSPKIKLEKVQEQTQEVTDNASKEDTTIADKILPDTGISKIIILSIVALTVTGICMFIKYKNIKLK